MQKVYNLDSYTKNIKKYNAIFCVLIISFVACNVAAQESFNKVKLTVVTKPIGQGDPHTYDGHYGVTRSLIEGLKKIGASFNYNPNNVDDIGDVLYVLADSSALLQAIELRKTGKIKKLLAGPTLFTRANECNHMLASPEIDTYFVNSPWTKQAYIEDEPSLKDRIQILFAGVDTQYWLPKKSLEQKTTNKVLVYWKTGSEDFCHSIESVLKKSGYEPIRIKYGHYSSDQFKKLLSKSLFSVFISVSESQGLALAESWSMDVPTLVWDPQEPLNIAGKLHWPISAAPYLNDKTGMTFKNINQLPQVLNKFLSYLNTFKPRQWVVSNMSDEVSARLLMDQFVV